ncbi:MAG: NDP-hexose 2,3-dehydratase family protein [Alphaproteobacteria bacterium]|nr:NDP-hexose 2,3-dehydratase family protein [Alphaproteobacteria bacterium]
MIQWLNERRASSKLQNKRIKFSDSREWSFDEGRLRHKTGGFFSIEGVVCQSLDPLLSGRQQPIINQPEIGILGFLVCETDGEFEWLVQAKGEPGNTHAIQLAPSVQATYSNYMRRHGGAATYYLNHFLCVKELMSDSLQSEQGTRFLRKFNRNAVSLVSEKLPLETENYRWLESGCIREALGADYVINTDARSVITTAPWRLVADGKAPFTGVKATTFLNGKLAQSYVEEASLEVVAKMHDWLRQRRQELDLRIHQCSLADIQGWSLEDDCVVANDSNRELAVEHYRVEAPGRERSQWDQPLVRSPQIDEVVLICQEREGVLRFLLRPAYEIGLTGGVEIGPSYKKDGHVPEWLAPLVERGVGRDLISVQQSDEGGRFMESQCLYKLVYLEPNHEIKDKEDNFWVTASELELICRSEKLLTNEARSVVSLLLSFA